MPREYDFEDRPRRERTRYDDRWEPMRPYSATAVLAFTLATCSLVPYPYTSLPFAFIGLCLSVATLAMPRRSDGHGFAVAALGICCFVLLAWIVGYKLLAGLISSMGRRPTFE